MTDSELRAQWLRSSQEALTSDRSQAAEIDRVNRVAHHSTVFGPWERLNGSFPPSHLTDSRYFGRLTWHGY